MIFFSYLFTRWYRIHSRSSGNTNKVGFCIGWTWQSSQSQRCYSLFDAHRRIGRIYWSIIGKDFPITFIFHGRQRPKSSERRSCWCCTHFSTWNPKTLPPENLSTRCCVDFGKTILINNFIWSLTMIESDFMFLGFTTR